MPDFNHVYSTKYPYGDKPNITVLKVGDLLAPNSLVFDVGIGDGKNAIYLARMGHTVDGIDSSPAAIKSLTVNIDENNLAEKIGGEVKDIIDYEFDQKYDALVCNFLLHFIPTDSFHDVLEKMKSAVKSGGYITIADFTNDGPMYREDDERYWLQNGELKTHFSDWGIEYYEEGIRTSRKGHKQMAVLMVAKKR